MRWTTARPDGLLAEDELFYAQQNALTVRNAEAYYRTMFGGRVTSWNLRDQHMAQTLNALLDHLDGTAVPTGTNRGVGAQLSRRRRHAPPRCRRTAS